MGSDGIERNIQARAPEGCPVFSPFPYTAMATVLAADNYLNNLGPGSSESAHSPDLPLCSGPPRFRIRGQWECPYGVDVDAL